jgi:hypothetical protein
MQKNMANGNAIRVQITGYSAVGLLGGNVELFNAANTFAHTRNYNLNNNPRPLFVGAGLFPFNLAAFGNQFQSNVAFTEDGNLLVYNTDNTELIYNVNAGAGIIQNGVFYSGFSYLGLMRYLLGAKISFRGIRLYSNQQSQLIENIEIFENLPDGRKHSNVIQTSAYFSPTQVQPNVLELSDIAGTLSSTFGINYNIQPNSQIMMEFFGIKYQ